MNDIEKGVNVSKLLEEAINVDVYVNRITKTCTGANIQIKSSIGLEESFLKDTRFNGIRIESSVREFPGKYFTHDLFVPNGVLLDKIVDIICGLGGEKSNPTEWQHSLYGDKIFLVDKVTSEILEEIEIHMGLCIEQVDYYEWNGRKFKDLSKVKKFIEENLKGKK